MAGASNKGNAQYCGLTPREVEFTIKAMITVLESGGKPDFEKLSRMTQYQDAKTANKNWNFVKLKLLNAAGSKNDGQASGDNKGTGEKGGKRQAVDALAAPEEDTSGVKVEEDEDLDGEV
ncbi:hypothetical protein KVR01_002943 [Diaporthe batatas]|uniref:uncharacterized protein n=1 Tax=Diaporthe batatas TaxID=748121 RepID=UPI001D052E3F|nr:uncharacterized protein KVR01_002943 [Diaporthe batatas]KAG8167254.1 hypothetical protein KVR01_002943 [Diaporthe batatas]